MRYEWYGWHYGNQIEHNTIFIYTSKYRHGSMVKL